MILRYGGAGLGAGSATCLVMVAMKAVQSAASAADRAVLGAVTPETLGMGEEVRIRWSYDDGNGGMLWRYWIMGHTTAVANHTVPQHSSYFTCCRSGMVCLQLRCCTYRVVPGIHSYRGRRIVRGTRRPSNHPYNSTSSSTSHQHQQRSTRVLKAQTSIMSHRCCCAMPIVSVFRISHA